MAKEYPKLLKTIDYDHDAVDELADAMTELYELKRREAYLEQIIRENNELLQFVWLTADGDILPHHKIEDDHFKNILQHLANGGRAISPALRSEARRREIPVPEVNNNLASPHTLTALAARVYELTKDATEGEIIDPEDY